MLQHPQSLAFYIPPPHAHLNCLEMLLEMDFEASILDYSLESWTVSPLIQASTRELYLWFLETASSAVRLSKASQSPFNGPQSGEAAEQKPSALSHDVFSKACQKIR